MTNNTNAITHPDGKRRRGRWAIWLILAIPALGVGAELLYIGVTFLLLSISPLQSLLPQDHSVSIRTARGWSWMPGHFHLRGVMIIGQDRNVLWTIKLPEVEAKLVLGDIRQKEIRFEWIKSDNVEFSLFMKQEPKEPRSPPSNVEEEKKHAMKLIFERIEIPHFSRIALDALEFTGQIGLVGGFRLWPGIEAGIGPATLHMEPVVLSAVRPPLKGGEVLDMDHFDFQGGFSTWSVPDVQGNDVLRYISGHLALDGKMRNWQFVNRLLTGTTSGGKFQLIGGDSRVGVDVNIERGRVRPDAKIEILSSALGFQLFGLRTLGDGSFKWEPGAQRLALAMDHYRTWPRDQDGITLLEGRNLRFHLNTGVIDIVHPTEKLWLELILPRSQIPRLTAWDRRLPFQPKKLSILEGSGWLTAHIYANPNPESNPGMPKGAHGALEVGLENWKGRYDKLVAGGQIRLSMDWDPIELGAAWAHANQTIIQFAADKSKPEPGTEASHLLEPGWWMRTNVDNINLRFSKAMTVEGDLHLRMRDSDPVAKVLELYSDIPAIQRWLIQVSPVKADMGFAMTEDGIDLKDLHLAAGAISAQGNLGMGKAGMTGAVRAKYGPIGFGFRFEGEKARFHLFPSDHWLATGE